MMAHALGCSYRLQHSRSAVRTVVHYGLLPERKPGGRAKLVSLVLLVLYIIPYWAFPYFPSQDGPSHLYTAGVLASHSSSRIYQQYYAIHLSPAGNVLAQALLTGLFQIAGGGVAEKLL